MSQIQQVKEAHNIVDVIGARLSLRASGAHFKGLCPFHNEKTPSFFVNQELQRYKCFGCGESGDVLTFLERYESMTFREALETLAAQAGIVLEREHRSADEEKRAQLLEILDLSRQYYHYLLTQHRVGQSAREYLHSRGVRAESIKVFQLGYALPKWDGLLTYLHLKKKYPLELLEQAGLIIRRQGGKAYDRFRGRLIFPLRNHRGQVVGFSGRLLEAVTEGERAGAKYINTPETSLYHKGQLLYGYSELHQFLRQTGEALVVEGELDLISSTQANVNAVVAIKGSALTNDHARLLKRTVKRVILALDADRAGVEASKRALQVLKPFALELRVVMMPFGQDPDEIARERPKEWRELVRASVTAYDFLMTMSGRAHDLSSATGKREVIQDLASLFWSIESAVEREVYLKKLAELVSAPLEAVRRDIEYYANRPSGLLQVREGGEATGATQVAPLAQAETSSQPVDRLTTLERYMLFLLLTMDEADYALSLAELLGAGVMGVNPLLRAWLAASPPSTPASPPPPTRARLLASLAEDLQVQLTEISLDEQYRQQAPLKQLRTEWLKALREHQPLLAQHQRQLLTAELAQLEQKERPTPAEQARSEEILLQLGQIPSS